jgi:uncharacterized membrane protein
MPSHAHYTKATISGHPIHALIVALPAALYMSGFVGLIVYAATHDPFWYHVSSILLLAGALIAAVAAVFGLLGLFSGAPQHTAARRTGVKHFAVQLLATLLFAGAGLIMLRDWVRAPSGPPHLRIALPLVLGLTSFVLMAIGSAFGGKAVDEPDQMHAAR